MIKNDVKEAFEKISLAMSEQKDYLIQLDQQNGDGDLGVSMNMGYKAAYDFLCETDESDLGKLFMKLSSVFNESAPSSLGTITSICFMGMAKSLKGKTEANVSDLAEAFKMGAENVCEKAGSKLGEKTILDAFVPAIEEFAKHESFIDAFEHASEEAKKGSENTANMRAVHGRAAYYGEKSLGLIDGGSVVAKIVFESIFNHLKQKA